VPTSRRTRVRVAEPLDERPAIHTVGLQKEFLLRGWWPGRPRGVVHALRGADLHVKPGTTHGVMGPNGSGKSTLLRILATLITPDGGTATVSGLDAEGDAGRVRRLIGFSTGEERSLYWRLTARQNLEFAAALHHLPEPRRAIDSALALVQLLDDADRPVSGFSQGMIRRLGLARAVLHEPPILLLDEPTRSLDPVARSEFQAVVTRLRNDRGVTTLITTHDLGEAVAVCDEVSVLSNGEIVDHLTPVDEPTVDRALRRLVP
jgi:ABC-2 type transport system ATP-binding protein